MRKGILGVSILLTISLLPAYSATPLRAGSACSKQGISKTYQGKKFTCIQSGKKLVWNEGVAVKKKVPTPAPTPTPTPTATPTATSTPSPTSTPIEITASNRFKKMEECQVSTTIEESEHYGFPRPSTVIPTLGERKAIVLFVYFDDLPFEQKQIDEWKNNQIPTFERYIEKMSYGKLKYKIETLDTFLHIKKSVLSYNLDTPHGTPMKPNANFGALIKDAADLADPLIDFSKYEFINVVTASTTKIGMEGAAGVRLTYDGKTFNRATFGPIREYVDDPTKKIWLLHEVGHTMGLIHQYKLSGPWSWNNIGFPIWSAMATGVSSMPEFLAWEKFLVGWFSQEQVRCINKFESPNYTVKINSLSKTDSGVKALMVRISSSQIIVVESRRSSELGEMSKSEEGALVYLVDANTKSDEGAVQPLFERLSNRDRFLIGTLRLGESVTTKGVKIEIVRFESDGDVVQVSKSNP